MSTGWGAKSSCDFLVIVGTRPEAIKLSPVVLALREMGLPPVVCLTGQHAALATDALLQFGIVADRCLFLMQHGQTLGALIERAVVALGALFARDRPRWVVVQGDTSSALCAAIAATQSGIPVAHVEAGLRSFNRQSPFPEEINRTLIARLAKLHFAPTAAARENLISEGVARSAIEVTGNTVVDALRWVEASGEPEPGLRHTRRLIVATLHRRENRGAPMANIVTALARLAGRCDTDIVLPVHPGIAAHVYAPLASHGSVRLTEPMGHSAFVSLLARAHIAITDSGGIQEEACALGVPTLVIRDETERPEVVEAGTAMVVGTQTANIVAAATRLLDDPSAHSAMARASTRFGDGRAGMRIARRLKRELRSCAQPSA